MWISTHGNSESHAGIGVTAAWPRQQSGRVDHDCKPDTPNRAVRCRGNPTVFSRGRRSTGRIEKSSPRFRVAVRPDSSRLPCRPARVTPRPVAHGRLRWVSGTPSSSLHYPSSTCLCCCRGVASDLCCRTDCRHENRLRLPDNGRRRVTDGETRLGVVVYLSRSPTKLPASTVPWLGRETRWNPG